MSARLRRAWDGLLWLLRPTGLRRAVGQLEERLHRMEVRQLEMESRLGLLVSPTNMPVEVHGHYMFLDRHDSLGLSLHHTHEPFQTQVVTGLLKPGDVFVDAGAHIGYYTLLAARAVGPAGRVIAFEASPYAEALLRRNLAANAYPWVQVHETALHDAPGRLAFFTCEIGLAGGSVLNPGGGNPWQLLDVEATALDAVLPPGTRVDFVKMDIQGAEGHALAGMQRCLKDNPNIRLLLEFWPRGWAASGTSPAEVLAWLEELGFKLQDVRETERAVVTTTPAELLERYPIGGHVHTNLLCARS